jgi:SAM-dependent methyltransferase
MHALERDYWWFQGRRRVILSLLDHLAPRDRSGPHTILDVGCGTGMLLEDLQTRGIAAGLDFSPVALEYCRGRKLESLGEADVRHLPIRSGCADIVTALDLIEHIEDDKGLLLECHRVLRPGGIAVMSVPAHKELWSTHDVALHHFRRYEYDEFRALVTGAGLRPVKYTYAVATAYIPAMLYRRVKRLVTRGQSAVRTDEFRLPRPINAGLLGIMKCEARYLLKHNLPFGLSLVCVAERPE